MLTDGDAAEFRVWVRKASSTELVEFWRGPGRHGPESTIARHGTGHTVQNMVEKMLVGDELARRLDEARDAG